MAAPTASHEPRTIRTYMSFQVPVDPANIKTLVDLDLSYALGSTLVNWTDSRTLTDGLATPLEPNGQNEIALKLEPYAKWSNGTAVTANEVVNSLNRAKKLYPNDLKNLFGMIQSIEAKDERTIIFHLNRPVASSQILHKLTEPMYGIVAADNDGHLDLRRTTGPFFMKEVGPNELVLKANPYWHWRTDNMPESVVVRRPKVNAADIDDNFADEPWPNLMPATSLMPPAIIEKYKAEHYSIWNRNLDRVLYISPGRRADNTEGRQLLQSLSLKLNRTTLMKGLSGYHLSSQFFPPGYVIFDPEFQAIKSDTTLPREFHERPLEILAPIGRLNHLLKANLIAAIENVTGKRPHIHLAELNKFDDMRSGPYDLVVMTTAVNDPNVDGAVSWVFSQRPPLIPNAGTGAGNFAGRIETARHLDEVDRYRGYRKVFTDAVHDGCVLPLFHFSSVAIARHGIDLSSIPTSDETVSFSKVRFK